jgi:hypothetical protein
MKVEPKLESMLEYARRDQELADLLKAIDRYLLAAKRAKEWSNNPYTYAERFRLNIREEFKDYSEALKVFDAIDKDLANA